MKKQTKNFLIFSTAFIIPMIYYRIAVLFFVEEVSTLRAITGLSIHHAHYGIILLTISILMFVFYKRNNLSIALAGGGLGLVLDEFIPSLLFTSLRAQEIDVYFRGFIPTVILFIAVILISIILYRGSMKK